MKISAEKDIIMFKSENAAIEFSRTTGPISSSTVFYENDSGYAVTFSSGRKKGLTCPVHPRISSIEAYLGKVRITINSGKDRK